MKRGHFDKLNDHALTGLLRQAASTSSTQAAQATHAACRESLARTGRATTRVAPTNTKWTPTYVDRYRVSNVSLP